MANIYMTGFEWGTKYEVSSWDSWNFCNIVTESDTSYVRSGNYALRMAGAYAAFSVVLPYPGGVTLSEAYMQFAFRSEQLAGDLFHWYSCSGDRRVGHLNLSEAGQVRLYVSNYDGYLIESSTLVAQGDARLQINKWYVFEMHIKLDNNYGALECRIDGVPDCDFFGDTCSIIGQIPGAGPLDQVSWAHMYAWMDDIVINDLTGTFNNSWPGCLKVVLLRPNDIGTYSQWTPSTEGHNYDMVNEVPYDPATFISTTGIGNRDLYYLEDLPIDAAEVMVVRGDAWTFKDSGSASQNRQLAFSVMPGLTITDSADHDLTLSYQLVKHPFDYNPDTNAIWTKEDVNNIQAGIKSSS